MNPEELLAHADFVRSLARLLVFDENTADDLAQQAYIAALEQPPGTLRSTRGWLAAVTKNLKNRWYRTESQRTIREQKVSSSEEGIPSTDDVVQREETRRKVVEAVLTLDEPHRSAVLLKFYEDLSTHEVAKRLNIKYETARGRIRRGLEKLRTKLDAEYGGDRDAWCLALLPMAGMNLSAILNAISTGTGSTPTASMTTTSTISATTTASTATVTGTSLTGLLTGVLLMSSKAKLFALLIFVAITGSGLWIFLPEDSQSHAWRTPGAIQPAIVSLNESESLDEESVNLVQDGSHAQKSIDGDDGGKEPIKSSTLFVAGKVTDMATGDAVKDFHISATMITVSGEYESVIGERIRDDEGLFHCPLSMSGTLTMNIYSSQYRRFVLEDLVIAEGQGISGIEVRLDCGSVVKGRVVDRNSGLPVDDAVVGTADGNPSTDLMSILIDMPEYLSRSEHLSNYTRTDRDGFFKLSGLDDHRQKIMAVHDDYVLGFVSALPGDQQKHEILLDPGFRIYGKASDDKGEITGDVIVTSLDLENRVRRPVLSNTDGRYITAPIPPGRVYLEAGPHPRIIGEFSPELKQVDVIDRDVEVNFGPSEETASWYGTLFNFDGKPIANAGLSLDAIVENQKFSGGHKVQSGARTDDDGCFEVHKLTETAYEVRVYLPPEEGNGNVSGGTIHLGDSRVLRKDVHLSGGAIQGTAYDGNTGLPLRKIVGSLSVYKDTEPFSGSNGYCQVGENGKFCLQNLEAGTFWLFFSDGKTPAFPVAEITMAKGEVIRDYELVLPETGKLDLSFIDLDPKSLRVRLQHENDDYIYAHLNNIQKNEAYEISYDLETGSWSLLLTHTELGALERKFSLLKGEKTGLSISRSDFSRAAGMQSQNITVIGKLETADRKPAKGLHLDLFCPERAGEGQHCSRSTTTDVNGMFRVENLKSGVWKLNVGTDENTRLRLPPLTLGDDALSPVKVTITMSEGRVRGRFVDRTTGLSIDDKLILEKLSIMHNGGYPQLLDARNLDGVTSFDFGNIPAGEYQLQAQFQWYKDYLSEPFEVAEGQHVDLGDVLLEPCGMLIVGVRDSEGKPIQSFRIENILPDGSVEFRHHVWLRGRVAPGKARFGNIPFGKSRIRISCTGLRRPDGTMQPDYQEQEKEIDCRPNEAVELNFVLQPK